LAGWTSFNATRWASRDGKRRAHSQPRSANARAGSWPRPDWRGNKKSIGTTLNCTGTRPSDSRKGPPTRKGEMRHSDNLEGRGCAQPAFKVTAGGFSWLRKKIRGNLREGPASQRLWQGCPMWRPTAKLVPKSRGVNFGGVRDGQTKTKGTDSPAELRDYRAAVATKQRWPCGCFRRKVVRTGPPSLRPGVL